MIARVVKIFIVCSLVLASVVLGGSLDVRLPGNNQGYEPEQPIAYSHRLHAGELGIDCRYCHYGVDRSPNAGIPPTSICLNCHRTVSTGFDVLRQEKELALAEERDPVRIVSPQVSRIYRAAGLDDALEPLPEGEAEPLIWLRVHDLPDYVRFDHRPHVARGIDCQACHGPVQTMERMRQAAPLTMGWCLDCHRVNAPGGEGVRGFVLPELGHGRVSPHVTTDCGACHY